MRTRAVVLVVLLACTVGHAQETTNPPPKAGISHRVGNMLRGAFHAVVQPIHTAIGAVAPTDAQEVVNADPFTDQLVAVAVSAAQTVYYPHASQPGLTVLSQCPGAKAHTLQSVASRTTGADALSFRVSFPVEGGGTKSGIIFAIRGTDAGERADWMASVKSAVHKKSLRIMGPSRGAGGSESRLCEDCGKAASGYYDSFISLRDLLYKDGKARPVKDACTNDKGEKTVCDFYLFTGHSLGGTTAQLLALDAILNKVVEPDKTYFVGFGSARVGNSGFAKKLRSVLPPSRGRLFVCKNPKTEWYLPGVLQRDPIPSYPLLSLGFKHAYDAVNIEPPAAASRLTFESISSFSQHRTNTYVVAVHAMDKKYNMWSCAHDLKGSKLKLKPFVPVCYAYHPPKRDGALHSQQDVRSQYFMMPLTPDKASKYKAKLSPNAPKRFKLFGKQSCRTSRHCVTGSPPCKAATNPKLGFSVGLFCDKGVCRCMQMRVANQTPFDCKRVAALS